MTRLHLMVLTTRNENGVSENEFSSFKTQKFKQAFYLLDKLYIARLSKHKNTYIQAFLSVSGYQTCTWKRGINHARLSEVTFQQILCKMQMANMSHCMFLRS